ncbi:MAG: hypothetical protein ACK4MF_06365 [Hyphomicrobiaceae bacterium]
MLELLMSLAQRPVVIALAISGALLVTAGSLMQGPRKAPPRPVGRWLSRIGYTLTFVSILLFIVAGYLSGR